MSNRKGFTLIEMLVVIAIVGLLSSVVVIGLTGSREKSRDARRIADIRAIQNALEINYTSATGYPSAIPAEAPQKDPQGKSYVYERTSNGFSYLLGIGLEGTGNDNFAAGNCPSAITAGPAFCVSPE